MRSLWQYLKARPVPRSDDDLLRSFVRERSEVAFTALVERHGGMVLGACQRILGHVQDAEDAYQAAFLVLARKAAGLQGTGPLGPWLYGVARRVALKALARRSRERTTLDPADAARLLVCSDEETALDLAEVRPILDAEVAKLPRKYRHVLVLCQLEGQTKAEAARQLGCPEGTVSSRLMRAKEMLRARLSRSGVTLGSLGVLDGLLAPPAASAALIQSTVQTAVAVTGGMVLVGAISPSVLSLSQGVTQAMMLTKLKLLAAGLVVIAGMSLGAGYVLGGGQGKGNGAGSKPAPGGVSQAAKPKPGETATPEKELFTLGAPVSEAIRLMLAQPTDRFDKRFGESFTLADQIDFLQKTLGITAILDMEAFREQSSDIKIEDILNSQVTIARMPGETLGYVVRSFLDGLEVKGTPLPCTYLVRRRALVIVPKGYVKQAAEKVDVALEPHGGGITLVDALEELARDTGVSIVLDPRVEEEARATRVRSSIRNVRLLSAVRMLANMANLSVINVDGALYVTAPSNAAQLQRQMDGTPEGPDKLPAVDTPRLSNSSAATAASPTPEKVLPSGKSGGGL